MKNTDNEADSDKPKEPFDVTKYLQDIQEVEQAIKNKGKVTKYKVQGEEPICATVISTPDFKSNILTRKGSVVSEVSTEQSTQDQVDNYKVELD